MVSIWVSSIGSVTGSSSDRNGRHRFLSDEYGPSEREETEKRNASTDSHLSLVRDILGTSGDSVEDFLPSDDRHAYDG